MGKSGQFDLQKNILFDRRNIGVQNIGSNNMTTSWVTYRLYQYILSCIMEQSVYPAFCNILNAPYEDYSL